MDAHPFKIQIPNEQLEDLQNRLHATRWPVSPIQTGWNDGADLPFIERLADYWRDRFDWRAQEARLNRLPQYVARVNNLDVHFVHQPGTGPAPLPLIITHGWPGSFIEMEHIIPLLTDPSAYGGDPADAFHVVVPSLLGYGFSQAPTEPGFHSGRIAELWVQLMRELGYDRFACQGGDIGAGVSAWMARLLPENVLGIHVNYIPGSYRPPLGAAHPPVTVEEQAFLDKAAAWTATEGAYAHLQGTKPQTLAYALTDSPIGLAAWMIEKFRSWSDCDGDVERAFGMDALLTDVSLYWFTNALTSSLRLYKENRLSPLAFKARERVLPPLGVALFPRELPMPPRSWVARVFDVQRMDADAAGRPFRCAGGTESSGAGHSRLLSADAFSTWIER